MSEIIPDVMRAVEIADGQLRPVSRPTPKPGKGEVLVRRVAAGAAPSAPVSVAQTGSGRSTGVPQLAKDGDRLIVAWRDERVRAAQVDVSALR